MIIDRATVKTYLGITVTTYDTLIDLYIPDVDAMIKEYTNERYYSVFAAAMVEDSPVITVSRIGMVAFSGDGLQRSRLKVSDYFKSGDYLSGDGIASGAYVLSVNDETAEVTLSADCTETATHFDLVKGFNRRYNKAVASLVWYLVGKTSVNVNADIGIKSKSLGPISITYDGAMNSAYGVPQALLDPFTRYIRIA